MSARGTRRAPRRAALGLVAAALTLLAWLAWPAPSPTPAAARASSPARVSASATLPLATPAPRGTTAGTAARALAPLPAGALELPPPTPRDDLGVLDKKTQKKAGKALKKANKAQSKVDGLAAKLVDKQADLAVAAADLAAAQSARDAAQTALDDALAQLLAAEALPSETAEQIAARSAALAAAQSAVTSAEKALAQADKTLAKVTKRHAKLTGLVAKLEAKIAVIAEVLEEAEQDVDSLTEIFDFDSLETYVVSLRVEDEHGAPVANVSVEIKDVLVPPKKLEQKGLEGALTPGLHLKALTDADGEVHALVDVPTVLGAVDLLIVAPGYSGTYSHEALRAYWGPFAPASRQAVDPDDLDGLTIVLSAEEG